MDKMPGPWREALPVVGNVLSLLRPDFHRKVLEYTDQFGGIFRCGMLSYVQHYSLTASIQPPVALCACIWRACPQALLLYQEC